ncbi:MAG: amidohydrolase family protein [Pseudomonadota bacterium]
MVQAAKRHGMITTVHTGGSSIPGSSGIWFDHLLKMQPDVSFHVNGGPVAMPDEDYPRIVHESSIALQLCTAGNLRTSLMLTDIVRKADQFDRLLIATDTPTGSGIMPLGMFYTISHLASLTDLPVEWAIAAATGNNAKIYRLNSGFLRAGCDADVVVIDACVGGSKHDALSAPAQRRHDRGRRRGHRRRAALRRPQPQHAGEHQDRAGRRMPPAARFLRRRALTGAGGPGQNFICNVTSADKGSTGLKWMS